MPNWTYNQLTVSNKVFDAITKNGEFSYQNIIPRPQQLSETISGGRVNDLIVKYLIDNFSKAEAEEIAHNMHLYNIDIFKKSLKEMRKILDERLNGAIDDRDARNIITGEPPSPTCYTGEDYYAMYIQYGFYDWYSWSLANWGVKWDASDVSINDLDDDRKMITFTSPWDMPSAYYQKICEMFPDETIEIIAEYEEGFEVTLENANGKLNCIEEKRIEYEEEEEDENEED